MLVINFKGNTPQQRFYCLGVQGNNKVDKIKFIIAKQQGNIDLSSFAPHIKACNKDHEYYDLIEPNSYQVVDDNIEIVWVMEEKTSQYRNVDVQILFYESNNNLIWQTYIVNLELGDTIKANEEVPAEYEHLLIKLASDVAIAKQQISYLQDHDYSLSHCEINGDNLILEFKNMYNETMAYYQLNIPLSSKLSIVADNVIVGNLPAKFIWKDYLCFMKSGTTYKFTFIGKSEYYYAVMPLPDLMSSTLQNVFEQATKYPYLLQKSENNIVYGNNPAGTPTTFGIDYGTNYNGNVARRDSNNQLHVPLTPTDNDHATSKKYVDDLIEAVKKNAYQEADYEDYTTLEDWLENFEGEEGILYLYPIDTSDLTKGYYVYVYEEDSEFPYNWVSLGTTKLDLSNYFQKNANLVPTNNGTQDIGSESYTWKDIYLSGKIDFGGNFSIKVDNNLLKFYYNTTAHIGISTSTIYVNTTMGTGNIRPQVDNQNDIGTSNSYYKDLYLKGKMYGATYSYSVDEVYKATFGVSISNPNNEILLDVYNLFGVSSATTFTFQTPRTNTIPEYKGNISNNSLSTIALTFTGVSKILCNDDNIVVVNDTNSVVYLTGETIIEFSVWNGTMVIVNFDV